MSRGGAPPALTYTISTRRVDEADALSETGLRAQLHRATLLT